MFGGGLDLHAWELSMVRRIGGYYIQRSAPHLSTQSRQHPIQIDSGKASSESDYHHPQPVWLHGYIIPDHWIRIWAGKSLRWPRALRHKYLRRYVPTAEPVPTRLGSSTWTKYILSTYLSINSPATWHRI